MRPPTWVRAALSHPCFTGISQQHLGDLIAEPADPWTAQQQAALGRRRGHAHHRLALCGRVLVTLVVLRLQLPHQALATLFGVDRVTITRAVGEVRPLLAARGLPSPASRGVVDRLQPVAPKVARLLEAAQPSWRPSPSCPGSAGPSCARSSLRPEPPTTILNHTTSCNLTHHGEAGPTHCPEPVAGRGSWRAPDGRRYRVDACKGHRPPPVEGGGPAV